MNIIPYSNKIDDYLKHDDVIDYRNAAITELAETLFQKADNEMEFIKITYEFVRDNISHSADINESIVTCTASEVLKLVMEFALRNPICWPLYCVANPYQLAFVTKS